MSVGPLIAEISFTFLFSAFLLHKYGNWGKHNLLVTVFVFISWYFSFIIIFILPVDISNTVYKQCIKDHAVENSMFLIEETNFTRNVTQLPSNTSIVPTFAPAENCLSPWTVVPDEVLPTLWRVVYWTMQALTWIILPLMQLYSTAGDFTITGKLKTAVIGNAIYYAIYLVIFGVLLLYIALKPNIHLDESKLKVICITASNTWGLLLLVLLLGYGLVEIPRSLWNLSRRGYRLNYLYFKASKLSNERCEAEERLDDVIEELMQVSENIPAHHSLRPSLEIVLNKCPEEKRATLDRLRTRTRGDASPSNLYSVAMTEKTLIRLHRQIIRALQSFFRTKCQWDNLVSEAFYWEDVARNELSHERTFKHRFTPLRGRFTRWFFSPSIEWYWTCIFRMWVLRSASIILALFSCMVVWSEMTFFTETPTLSIFAVIFYAAKDSYNYALIEIGSIVTIAYLCVCAYYTVFKVRIFNYYYLAGHHQTNEYSLIFCGMMLCRLTPPLCLNVLGLIHLDSHVIRLSNFVETSYTGFMGHMDVISIISKGFNIYFPMAIFLLCVATYFNLWSRFLHMIGFEQFLGDDEITFDLVEEGRELIKREKNRRQRHEDGELRRKRYTPKTSKTTSQYNANNRNPQTQRKDMGRSPSEENARSELLRDVEPIDYTDTRNAFNDFRVDTISETEGYNRVVWSQGGVPPAGLFDDV